MYISNIWLQANMLLNLFFYNSQLKINVKHQNRPINWKWYKHKLLQWCSLFPPSLAIGDFLMKVWEVPSKMKLFLMFVAIIECFNTTIFYSEDKINDSNINLIYRNKESVAINLTTVHAGLTFVHYAVCNKYLVQYPTWGYLTATNTLFLSQHGHWCTGFGKNKYWAVSEELGEI